MARPNRKMNPETTETKVETPETETTTAAEAAPAPEPKARQITVYAVNPAEPDDEDAERKPVKAESVGGVMLTIIADLVNSGRPATKAAILEEFRATEKAATLKAQQWVAKPQEYVNGYIDWLKGNRSVVSWKADL